LEHAPVSLARAPDWQTDRALPVPTNRQIRSPIQAPGTRPAGVPVAGVAHSVLCGQAAGPAPLHRCVRDAHSWRRNLADQQIRRSASRSQRRCLPVKRSLRRSIREHRTGMCGHSLRSYSGAGRPTPRHRHRAAYRLKGSWRASGGFRQVSISTSCSLTRRRSGVEAWGRIRTLSPDGRQKAVWRGLYLKQAAGSGAWQEKCCSWRLFTGGVNGGHALTP